MNSEPFANKNEEPFAGQDFNESIDTAIATIQTSQLEFSVMADSKANIMITVCSILLGLAIAKIEQGILIIPGAAFVIFCIPALLFSILTVLPSNATRAKPVDSVGKLPHFNPLFFMHFSLVPMKVFEYEFERAVTDPQQLYQRLTRDIYIAGTVLRTKKFRYLRWSYLSLMAGIGVACVALVVELILRAQV